MSQVQERKTPRTREGIVTSSAPQKSAVVSVTRRFKHARYHKFIQRDQKYLVHDENNDAAVGDRVQIAETRPISKRKHWKLTAVLERAIQDPLATGIADEDAVLPTAAAKDKAPEA